MLKGSWAESSFLVIGPVLSEYLPEQNETETEITTTMLPMTTILPTEELNEDVHNGSLVIFDRVYDAGIFTKKQNFETIKAVIHTICIPSKKPMKLYWYFTRLFVSLNHF